VAILNYLPAFFLTFKYNWSSEEKYLSFYQTLKCAIPRPIFQMYKQFLADRTNGRAYATVLRLSVCLSVCRL